MPLTERLTSSTPLAADVNYDHALRPRSFTEYIGQPDLIYKLRIATTAARQRGEPVRHILLHGPPGLGKTTLAYIIANEIGTSAHITSGPIITQAAELHRLLHRLKYGDVLFIDEIHRLTPVVEESLYSAMEDFRMDFSLKVNGVMQPVSVPLQPFTLIGATTRLGLLTAPMRARFGIVEHMAFYSPSDLHLILHANAGKLKVSAHATALSDIASRSRGTPRIANRLLRTVRDYAEVEAGGEITPAVAQAALKLAGIDRLGLDEQDRKLLRTLIDVYGGGPAGVTTLAATINEEPDTVSDVIEPYLLQSGLLARTPRGRCAMRAAYAHLGRQMIGADSAAPVESITI